MKLYPYIFFCFGFLSSASVHAQSSMVPVNLRCEYLSDPEGMDEISPRLSWLLRATQADGLGQRQTAYHILVSQDSGKLQQNLGDVWDSGWIMDDDMQHIVYSGRPLQSDRSYFWKVRVKDEAAKTSPWSAVAHWSMGLLKPAAWTARWIGGKETFDPEQKDCNVYDPWFRKVVELNAQPGRAMMFIASVGYHELYVNGKKIGEDVLSPCVSDQEKRARYVAYNISSALRPGKNVIAVWLGVSWSIFPTYASADKPRAPVFIAQADIYSTNIPDAPAMVRIQTDDSWKTHPSPNKLLGVWNFGNMGGELWDATKEIPDWNVLSCDESNWKAATIFTPRLMLTAQMVEPNRTFYDIRPVAIEQRPDHVFRVDMGVNFAGWTEIKVKGQPGQRVDFLFSEREREEMTFRNHSAVIIGSSGEAVFHNRFNYSSGRWISIKGLKEKPALSDIRGWVVRTNYVSGTSFSCSDTLQNWIYQKVCWNFENLSLGGYVVDCPQRERLGYGGDANATSETGMYNFRLGAFYSKWMEDWRDVQGTKSMDARNYGGNADDGILPHTAPTIDGGGGPPWGGICTILPWSLYQHEGDRRILERNFQLIKRWLAFLDTHVEKDLLVRFGGPWDFLGDWLWPHAYADGMNNDKPENICFNNCFRVYNLRTAVKIAEVLGKKEEADQWAKEAAVSSLAIQAKYFNATDNSYADSSMGNLAIALMAAVPPPSVREAVMKRLEKEILVVQHGHTHVGITAGAVLFKFLRAEGRDDLMYSMTSQTGYPGWGYMKENGATSIWEMWEKDLPGHSLLHSSYLYPGAWYIDGVAGIRRDPDNPGFHKFIVRPPRLKESQISWAKASFESPVGLIKTSWKRDNGHLQLEVTVPPNSSATVYFPSERADEINLSSTRIRQIRKEKGYSLFEIPAGKFTFSGNEYGQ